MPMMPYEGLRYWMDLTLTISFLVLHSDMISSSARAPSRRSESETTAESKPNT